MKFTDEDINAVAVSLKDYDETALNKSWRDLAIVAISAMTSRTSTAPVPEGSMDLTPLVGRIHKAIKPQTFGDARMLDTVCSFIMGEKEYEQWLGAQSESE